ncbi:hypothetical protein WJX74_007079 [Apatococcus lobatus]|uniref:SnoaL-like domain-containing protein n=1 Tax=Apatococcus lobatus TaxID=904363 RepID=A0AAW1R3T2_9CHLO
MASAIVEKAGGALSKGDLQACVDCFSEDAVLTMHVNPAVIPHGGVHHGRAGVKHFFETAFSLLEVRKGENLHIIAQGDIVIWRGWADICCRATKKSCKLQYTITWHVKDGKIISYDELVNSAAEEALFTR